MLLALVSLRACRHSLFCIDFVLMIFFPARAANLDKTKLSGNDQVDKLQDSINDTVAGQLGPGGMLQPVGDASSKEGVNRAERGGKDADGSYGGPVSSATDPVVGGVKGGASTVGNTIGKGAEGVSTLWKGSGEGKKDESSKGQ
jgi:hypothetical protein